MIKRKSLAFLTAAFLIAANALPALATTNYVENVVDETFSSSTVFLAPGDINGDGVLNALDVTLLKKQLLGISEYNECSDVNGDFSVNVIDLVRQCKNMADKNGFFSTGKINLNGKSVINGNQLSVLGTGAEYQIECLHSSPLKVVISGVWAEDKVLELSADQTALEITTPKTISDPANAKISLIGTDVITEVKFTRINMDNELSANSIK